MYKEYFRLHQQAECLPQRENPGSAGFQSGNILLSAQNGVLLRQAGNKICLKVHVFPN
jgi:hypothetical protein